MVVALDLLLLQLLGGERFQDVGVGGAGLLPGRCPPQLVKATRGEPYQRHLRLAVGRRAVGCGRLPRSVGF